MKCEHAQIKYKVNRTKRDYSQKKKQKLEQMKNYGRQYTIRDLDTFIYFTL